MKVKEKILQSALHNFFLKNTSFVSRNKKLITVLSVGEHNYFEGPDFLNACIIIDGQLLIGDIEFHKKSSYWLLHKHSTDPRYSNVILHVVLHDDKQFSANFETITIEEDALLDCLQTSINYSELQLLTGDDLQQYAVLRLMRKTIDVAEILKNKSIKEAFIITTKNFIDKYSTLRRRPLYSDHQIQAVISLLLNSSLLKFILKASKNNCDFEKYFEKFLLKEELNLCDNLKVGKHFKQEIITNVALPLLFCVVKKSYQNVLLKCYWAIESKTNYSVLSRKFPEYSQKYVWQQQAMLEHLKEYSNQYKSKPSDMLINYNMPEIAPYFNISDV